MDTVHQDYWLANAPENWQPKREIADYVEAQGFPVPKRFSDPEAAIATLRDGHTIIFRSEHPDEYDGPSGLLDSVRISPQEIEFGKRIIEIAGTVDLEQVLSRPSEGSGFNTEKDFRQGRFADDDIIQMIAAKSLEEPEKTESRLLALARRDFKMREYATYVRQSPRQSAERISYSAWEYIDGDNVTVVSDSALDGRYHVFLKSGNREGPMVGGITDETAEFIRRSRWGDITQHQEVGMRRIISDYETIRNLARFDPEHCPIMEFQLDSHGQHYFLQTHRTRGFSAHHETLDPTDFPDTEGWIATDHVRGATQGTAVGLKAAFWYPEYYGRLGRGLPLAEEASFDMHWNLTLSEVMSRRRTAFIETDGFDKHYQGLACKHDTRSKWFKPLAAVAVTREAYQELIPEEVKRKLSETVVRGGNMARIVLDIASDGRNGFIRLNPDSEQPVLTEN